MAGFFLTKWFRGCCFLLLITGAFMQLVFAFQEQSIFSDLKSGEKSLLQSSDPQLLTLSAQRKHLFGGDMDDAMSLLQRALTGNTYYVPAWLALAELNNDLGDKPKAYAILDYVNGLTRNLKRWRWEKTNVDYQLGRMAVLPAELRYIIGNIPGKSRNDALQLAFTLWDDPEQLLQNVGPENLLPLFDHAVQKSMPDKALFFWSRIEDGKEPWQQKQLLSFLEMLLRSGKVAEAGIIWRTYLNPNSLVYDGNFLQPFMQQAFGWRSSRDQGFEKRFAESGGNIQGRSLHYRFKGWDNLRFQHLYQIVPLVSGRKYQLTAEFKSAKMTTDQRPYLEISGYKCTMPNARTDMVAPNQDWQQYQIDFAVPEDCAAIVVRLRRNESLQIDSKLAGQLWMKNIVISSVGEQQQ